MFPHPACASGLGRRRSLENALVQRFRDQTNSENRLLRRIEKLHLPLYFLSVPTGRYAGASDCSAELADRDAAWKELTGVCGDMVGGISRILKQNSEWQR